MQRLSLREQLIYRSGKYLGINLATDIDVNSYVIYGTGLSYALGDPDAELCRE
jgi:hypothetical protein